MVRAIVGANWGDEGKGKITDMLGQESDIIVRFQGGANAGHTIVNDYGKFALHTLPSGIFYGHTTSIIGNGVALNVPVLFQELKSIIERGVPAPKLLISDRAQMVMSYHILFDKLEEERLAGRSFGSTKSGIAPFYSDKYAKIGFQVSDLQLDEEALRERIRSGRESKNVLLEHLYHAPMLKEDDIYQELMEYKEMVSPYVCDVSSYLWQAIKDGKNILLEGQLGTLKDPDHGIYPMVTSSSTLAAYGAIGAGIPPYEIKQVITVCKAYSSAVGAGAFVSELFGDEAEELRRRGGDGGEYGATTGRPRRVGWFDCVASRYGCRLQGTTDVAFTVMDVIGYLDELKVCVGYEIDGQVTTEFPTTPLLEKAKPVYETLPGWKCEIRGIRKYEDLPENCRNYIEFIEKQIGFPITMVSNGPGRNDIIRRQGLPDVVKKSRRDLFYLSVFSAENSSSSFSITCFLICTSKLRRQIKEKVWRNCRSSSSVS
ncbi:MAG: adenylosuccinate synthase [Lachnospiraceae bacterium]|nr:adenylosuccinate synthase [Lachnospiraceae bacterium]